MTSILLGGKNSRRPSSGGKINAKILQINHPGRFTTGKPGEIKMNTALALSGAGQHSEYPSF